MTRRTFTFLATALASGVAGAHDPKLHKGRKTEGEIVSIAEDRLELKTGKRTATVLLSEKPKVERGNLELSIAALKRGDRVTVVGTTLASGEIVAREIIIAGGKEAAPSKGHAGHHH